MRIVWLLVAPLGALLLALVVQRGQPLVNPAVYGDLVIQRRRLNFLDHLRVQLEADRRHEPRHRYALALEHPEQARHTVHGAILAARNHFVVEVAGRQRRGGVVGVERETDRHLGAIGPRGRLQTPAGADVEHLLAKLIQAQLDAGQRVGARALRLRRRRLCRGRGRSLRAAGQAKRQDDRGCSKHLQSHGALRSNSPT